MADSTQLVAAQMAYDNEKKTGAPAWILWWFTGGLGGHRYYLGDIGYAVAMTFCNWMTLGIWGLVDAFFINRRLREKNAEKQREIFARYGVVDLLPPQQFPGQYGLSQERQQLAAAPQRQQFEDHGQRPLPMTTEAPAPDSTFAPRETAEAAEAAAPKATDRFNEVHEN